MKRFLYFAFACWLMGVEHLQAATFSVDDFGGRISLEGDIKAGDAERAVQALLSIKPMIPHTYLLPATLQVNSRGGDLVEAFRLAALFKALYIDIIVAPNGTGVCASSCFFVYLAGLERSAAGIDKLKREGASGNFGPIGIHRPYFKSPGSGPLATTRQNEAMEEATKVLRYERVPVYLIDRMMSYASNDVYWLSTEDIRSIGKFHSGIEEELIAACGYDAKREDQMSARETFRDIKAGVRNCMSDHIRAVYGPLRLATFRALQNGSRPWTK